VTFFKRKTRPRGRGNGRQEAASRRARARHRCFRESKRRVWAGTIQGSSRGDNGLKFEVWRSSSALEIIWRIALVRPRLCDAGRLRAPQFAAPMSYFDKASATSRLRGGRGLRSRIDKVDAAFWLLLGGSALAFHRGDGLTCLDVRDDRLVHEASGAGDIRGPIPHIGQVLTTA
jgi:hypothetical protein